MNILIVGSGGREHALAWKLKQSRRAKKVYVAPGNAGTAIDAENVPISELDFPALIKFAKENKIHLTVVGPEVPLAAGIVDAFEREKLRIFGPNKAAAQLEGSKVFCKEILRKGNVPTGSCQVFYDGDSAIKYLNAVHDMPVVVKADGLAAGRRLGRPSYPCQWRSPVATPRGASRRRVSVAGATGKPSRGAAVDRSIWAEGRSFAESSCSC